MADPQSEKPVRRIFKMSEEEFRRASNNYEGRCLACGDTAENVEPDARKYHCSSCRAMAVYGLENLLLMGRLAFDES